MQGTFNIMATIMMFTNIIFIYLQSQYGWCAMQLTHFRECFKRTYVYVINHQSPSVWILMLMK